MKSKKQWVLTMIGAGMIFCLISGASSGYAATGSSASPVPDNGIYAGLLAAHVKNGVVDYGGFKRDEPLLDQYLNLLESTDVSRLPRNGQMAYYINLYNAWTIKLILSKYPDVQSIKDLGGFFSGPWKIKLVRLKGDLVTLDHIEHDILRPIFKDPRVHFAVNCASKGCPPLLSEPFEAARLDRQLDQVTRAFINDPGRNYLAGNSLHVSSIFKWFSEDFNDDVAAFLIQYADKPLKKMLEGKRSGIKIKYLDYDWSLNGR